jgi:glycosyltransferase involved in cell wall biosynthesis
MIGDYGADAKRVHVIPPGVDVEKWRCPVRDQSGTTHILFVGGDFQRKGGDLLLDWATKTTRKDWELHIVTRHPFTPTNPHIHVYNGLSPNDPQLTALYRQAHLFALPTRGDCYSLAGIEAMAAGLPVILSRTGGTGDILREGETGYLIGAGDGAALAERLEFLLENPAERVRMGSAAQKDAEDRYDAAKNIRKTVQIMREALG